MCLLQEEGARLYIHRHAPFPEAPETVATCRLSISFTFPANPEFPAEEHPEIHCHRIRKHHF